MESFVACLALVCAALLWIASLQKIDLGNIDNLGLVSALPFEVYAALAILTINFVLFTQRPRPQRSIVLLHIVLLIVIIHGTPAILYEALRYSWAWKHVGIVDFIQRHGAVDPTIRYLNANQNWPGFFALAALVTEVAGFNSALSFAKWAPVFFHLLALGALRLIYQTFTSDERLIWLSVWIYYLANWVGQDYFAPQAFAFVAYLYVVGICLRWFRQNHVPQAAREAWVDDEPTVITTALLSGEWRRIPEPIAQPVERMGLIAIVMLLMYVIAFTHQLTPIMIISALSLLVVFQCCRAYSLPLLAVVLMVSWLVFMATYFLDDNIAGLIEALGAMFGNVDDNFIDLSRASSGQAFVSLMGRTLTLGVAVLAVFGWLRRLSHRCWDLPAMLLAAAPFPMAVVTPYGGEILFRVYLFALPFLAFFVACLVYPSVASGDSGKSSVATVVLSGGLIFCFMFAYYGKDQQYHFTAKEIEVARYVYENAPPGSLLVEGSRNYPMQFKNYENFTYVPLTAEPPDSRSEMIASPVEVLRRWLGNSDYTAAYLVLTRSQKAEVNAVGEMPPGSLERIEQALLRSPDFTVVYGNEDAKVFTLTSRIGRPQ